MKNMLLELFRKHEGAIDRSPFSEMAISEHNYDDLADDIIDQLKNTAEPYRVGDKVRFRGMELIVVETGIGEILIATTENADAENYNDWWVDVRYVKPI